MVSFLLLVICCHAENFIALSPTYEMIVCVWMCFHKLVEWKKKKKPDKRCACRTYKELVQSKKKTFSSTEKKGGAKEKIGKHTS